MQFEPATFAAYAVVGPGHYVGGGVMVDAPDTGTVERVQSTPTVPGAPWGTDVVVGLTGPGG